MIPVRRLSVSLPLVLLAGSLSQRTPADAARELIAADRAFAADRTLLSSTALRWRSPGEKLNQISTVAVSTSWRNGSFRSLRCSMRM